MTYNLLSKSLLPVALAGAFLTGGCQSKSNPSETAAQPPAASQPAPAADATTPPATGPASAPAGATMAAQPPAPAYREAAPSGSAEPGAAGAASVTRTIPAGTPIRVTLGEALSSKTSQSGQTFHGTVASSVRVNGRTVIPAGAAASGTVVGASSQGRFKGAGELDLRLDTVRTGGRSYPVQTSNVTRVEKGKGKRTAVMTGGGGGLGAIIGGLAGGGKGALIGGLAGAGAGGAGSALTGNSQVSIPAETVLTFTLQDSVTVR